MRRAFYQGCALKINRAPENRSAARFLGKRSGRRSGQGGKRSAPPAMAPWRDEAQRGETAASTPRNFARRRTAGFPLPHGKFFCQLKRIFVNHICIHSPVSASWNIIQYPLPCRSNTERGINEQNPRRALGGSERRSAGTP